MTLNVDKNGNIYIHQGDSGDVYVNGIPTDKNYRVYLAVKDLNRKTVGNEFMIYSEYKSCVKFTIPSSFSNLLNVAYDEHIAVYHYGLKICDNDGLENTLSTSNSDIGKPGNIIVFPKLVEGYYEQE